MGHWHENHKDGASGSPCTTIDKLVSSNHSYKNNTSFFSPITNNLSHCPLREGCVIACGALLQLYQPTARYIAIVNSPTCKD